MADEATSPTGSTEVAGGSTGSNNGAPPAKVERVKIATASTGGGFSLDEFNRSLGRETDNVDTDDDTPSKNRDGDERGELLEDEDEKPVKRKEPVEEDDDSEDSGAEESDETEAETDEDEDSVSLEEATKGLKNGIKAVTKDGKEFTLPKDLEIVQVVDGEARRINLREHLNVVAGELTVESRMGKVASFRESVEKRRQEIEGVHAEFQNKLQTLVGFAAEGKPDQAICFLAEMNGISPIQMKRQFLKALVAEATKFEGKSEVEIDNYYLNLENKWRTQKDAKAKENEGKQKQANDFIAHVNAEIEKENLTSSEFSAASKQLQADGALEGLNREAKLDRVIEHALLVKHHSMVSAALQSVNPKLLSNRELFASLLDSTHPNRFTVEEIAQVVKDYLGNTTTRIASRLSKHVRPEQVTTKAEKQNGAGTKKKVYRNASDLQRAFGL